MAKTLIKPRGPTAVDTHVGQKIRARRIFLRMSQTEIADAAGISFQQIQKYENETSRGGTSRLQQISNALGVLPFYFFEGALTVGKKRPAPNEGELPEDEILSFLATREGAALARGFLAIKKINSSEPYWFYRYFGEDMSGRNKMPRRGTAGQVMGGKAKPHIQPCPIATYRDSSSMSNQRASNTARNQ
jgi:transcriptional regulator with XRE-family HTH domain